MNRVPVKWVRDRAKSAYTKDACCYICGTTEDLDLHHTNSIAVLLENYIMKNGIVIHSDEDIIEIRDDFIAKHHDEIYKKVYTLCKKHHKKLHSLFGKAPLLQTATKQENWIEKQKAKYVAT